MFDWCVKGKESLTQKVITRKFKITLNERDPFIEDWERKTLFAEKIYNIKPNVLSWKRKVGNVSNALQSIEEKLKPPDRTLKNNQEGGLWDNETEGGNDWKKD